MWVLIFFTTGQGDRPTDRPTEIHTYIHTYIQTDRQTDTHRQTDTVTDIDTERAVFFLQWRKENAMTTKVTMMRS